MSAFGEPDWTTPGVSSAAAVPTEATSNATLNSNSPSKCCGAGCVQKILSLLVVGIGSLMMVLAIFGLISFKWEKAVSYSDAFVSIYMIIFATLLLAYELTWWASTAFVNKSLRKNFGFLYGIRGKSLFIIFVAFLTFGLEQKTNEVIYGVSLKMLGLGTGISFFAVGVLHLTLYFLKPDLLESYKAPSAGFDFDPSEEVPVNAV